MADSKVVGHSRRVTSRTGPGTPNGVVVDTVYRTSIHTSSDSKAGTKNPFWKDRVRRMTQAGSAYARNSTVNGFVTGHITGSYREGPAGTNSYNRITTDTLSGELFLDSFPGVPVSAPDFTILDTNARVNFLSKCRGAQRAFQSGVFLGELRETIHMIIRPASALRRGISSYLAAAKKAYRRASPNRRASALTGTWLEYSYGWRPLFKDVDDGMAALADTDHIVPDIIAGSSKDEWTVGSGLYSTGASGSFVRGAARARERHQASVRYLGCVGWESTNRASTWQSHWGLTLSDFAPTVWELIPYSFLVDYFSNVGAVIDASSFGVVQLRWGVRSSFGVAAIQSSALSPVWSGLPANAVPLYLTSSLSFGQLSRFSFNRALVSSVSVGLSDLHFKIPGIGDWRKWANIAALASQKAI